MLTLDTVPTARFMDKEVHIFRGYGSRTTYCGLHERDEIWSDLGNIPTCLACTRLLDRDVQQHTTRRERVR